MSHDFDTFFLFALLRVFKMNNWITRILLSVCIVPLPFFPPNPFMHSSRFIPQWRRGRWKSLRDHGASPIFHSGTLHNTLALTVPSLRGLNTFAMWFRLILSEGEQHDPLLTAVS